jgi:hypothetical protein
MEVSKMVKKYRKKPVVVEAFKLDGNALEVARWCNGYVNDDGTTGTRLEIVINTLEGKVTATDGDYVIKGVQGEFYPCKPDIFEATYEEVK